MDLARLNLQDNNQLKGKIPLELCNRISDGSLSVMISGTNIVNYCVLDDLYYSTSGDGWINNNNWLDLTISHCEWYGMTCEEGSETITQISLTFNNLQGSIPASISTFSGLQRLNLEGNALTGTIPTEVGLLSSLYRLDLYRNSLTGTIPTEVGLLSDLNALYLNYNSEMNGTIPMEVCNLIINNGLSVYITNTGIINNC